MQISDSDLAKVRLKCVELAVSGDVSSTLRKAAILAAWVMRPRTARSERTPPAPEAPPPPLPERLQAFKLGIAEAERRAAKPAPKPTLTERVKSTLGGSHKNK